MTTGRPPHVLRPTKLTTNLPEDIRAKLDIYLFSSVEGRIPYGAYSQFLAQRVKEFFDTASPAAKLAGIKTRIEQIDCSGPDWTEEQRTAIGLFKDHILGFFK